MPKRGGKRVKKRTHVAATDETEAQADATGQPIPRSMVIRAPKTSLPHTLQVLQMELRKVMSPYTAQKLKERRYNTLKDYTHVATLMKVTHLLLLAPGGKRKVDRVEAAAAGGEAEGASMAGAGALLKIGRMPQGPTLTLRVTRYSLCRQVRLGQKRSYDVKALYEHPPLVVLNNFGSTDGASCAAPAVAAHLKLMRITFQNMFPPLDVASVRLADCRRVVLFHYDKDTESVEMRHYCIRATPVAVSKPVKRVLLSSSKALPDLGHLGDISDWLLGGGGDGDLSESEAEEAGSRVVLPQKVRGRGNQAGQTSAVKLSELGPRVTMTLFKVERGLCEGDVMFHALESKTPAEVAAQRARKSEAEGLKRKRREEQEANVAKKQDAEEAKRAAKRGRREAREAAVAAAQTEAAAGRLHTLRQKDGGDGDDDDDDGDY